MELQRQAEQLRAEGLGLAAISYDSRETLAAFAAKYQITFPLLSDAGSATIRRWGILNAEATGRTAGIPHPGTFVISPAGRIVSRTFEPDYQVRSSAQAILGTPSRTPGRLPKQIDARYLSLTTSQSDERATPGSKLSLYVDVVPKPKMHVYAPEQTGGYIRIELELDADPAFASGPAAFPKASSYYFKPLDETFKVFNAPFRIRMPVTVALTPDVRRRAGAKEPLAITGTLRYQACDDKVCYRPDEVRVSWLVTLQPLVGR